MSYTILLYGATGFSGRLIAAEAAAQGMSDATPAGYRVVLGGRDARALKALGDEHGMDVRVFGLDVHADIVRNLDGINVVLNAAGPFAFTAQALAKASLEYGCHYVDINGEVDVYLRLDDYGRLARQLDLAMVSGAAFLGGASNVLLGAALDLLKRRGHLKQPELGDIRFGMTALAAYTSGSALSAWRSLREEVAIVRRGRRKDQSGELRTQLVLWHEPLGKLEHAFDFVAHPDPDLPKGARLSVASAANFVDTLAARRVLARRALLARSIVSYLELGALSRLSYAFGGILAPLSALPGIDGFARAQLAMLPDKLGDADLQQPQVVVLQIEGMHRERLIDWVWETPNAYVFSARMAVAVAREAGRQPKGGWLTPAEVLNAGREALTDQTTGPFRGCTLTQRRVP